MSTSLPGHVEVVEVGLRDGLQSVATFVATDRKIAMLRGLHEAGLRRVEVTSFVSNAAVPQLADAAQVLAAAQALEGLDAHVLVPTLRQAERALEAGARHIAFVLSVSDWHNWSNVRCSPIESVDEFKKIVKLAAEDTRFRLNVATAFDCPKLGRISPRATLDLVAKLAAVAPALEIALCDTTGRADPVGVGELFETARDRFPTIRKWAFHGHDTYGLGAVNAFAAWRAGVDTIDASFAGLGGCPFAPGATGNVATEDVVWMFEKMGVSTGIDIEKLVQVAAAAAAIPGAQSGGRVRHALAAAARISELLRRSHSPSRPMKNSTSDVVGYGHRGD